MRSIIRAADPPRADPGPARSPGRGAQDPPATGDRAATDRVAPRARGRGRRWLAAGAIALAGTGLLLGPSLEARQRQWIFQPSRDTWWAGPDAVQGMAPVWIDFMSKDSGSAVRLHGLWLAHGDDADAPVLLYLHGARWNMTGSAARMRRMRELGFSVLAIDYRGFGESSDASGDQSPSEARVYEDARAAWDWLGRQHPERRRYVFGHSLGSAIAVQLASEVGDASGLIVEAAFTSIPALVSTFEWGWLPVAPLITQRFDAESRIARVKAPLLVVHGSDDRLVPPSLGRRLHDKATAPKRFVLVAGGSHHSTNALGQAQYGAALRELFGPRL